jgi:peroxiredoxin
MPSIWFPLLLSFLPGVAPPPASPAPDRTVTDFSLPDHLGHLHHLSDFRDRKLIVVVFLGVDCPLAKLYAPRLADLARTYGDRGVTFLAIDPNERETLRDLARYVHQHGLPFPLLKDPRGNVADNFGAQRSPEAFILDEKRTIRYRGRIDDAGTVTARRQEPTRRDLVEALDDLLAGRAVRIPSTPAGGCPLSRPRVGGKGSVTWSRDVAPIVQRRCQVCHRPGQSAPFSLLSYDDAVAWSGAMGEVIEEGRMPPWGADPKHGKFSNNQSLTAEEKSTLLAWIAGGCVEGNRADLPAPRRFPEGWSIPGPDLVISLPEPQTVPAEGVVDYLYISVDPGFREDRWVKAAEVMPGNKAVVHHCNVFLQPPGVADPELMAEVGKLGSFCLTMMAPGTPPQVLPDGMAKRIPAGWRIVFVMHYQTIGSVQTDRTSLGLTFADPATVKQEVATKLMYDLDLRIPPRDPAHRVTQTWTVNHDILLVSLFPHMHFRGKSFRYEVLGRDGKEEILLDVPRYDFNWQQRYELAEPIRVPAGSRIRCTAVYDNSADNPANPNPDAEVRTGKQSWEEMFNGYFDVVLADEDMTRPVPWWERLWEGAQRVCRPPVAVLGVLFGVPFLYRRRIGQWLGAKSETGANPEHPTV